MIDIRKKLPLSFFSLSLIVNTYVTNCHATSHASARCQGETTVLPCTPVQGTTPQLRKSGGNIPAPALVITQKDYEQLQKELSHYKTLSGDLGRQASHFEHVWKRQCEITNYEHNKSKRHQADIESLKEQLASQKKQYTELQQELSKNEEEKQANLSTIKRMEEENIILTSNHTELQNKYNELFINFNKLEQEHTRVKDTCANLEKELAETRFDRDVHKAAFLKLSKRIETDMQEADAKDQRLTRQSQVMEQTNVEAQGKIQMLTQQLKELEEAYNESLELKDLSAQPTYCRLVAKPRDLSEYDEDFDFVELCTD